MWEVAGFREAIDANVALDTLIETADLPERDGVPLDHARAAA